MESIKGDLDTDNPKGDLELWLQGQFTGDASRWISALHVVVAVAEEAGVAPAAVVEVLTDLHPMLVAAVSARQKLPELRADMARYFSPSLADLDPVPKAAVEQAQRVGALRATLLKEGGLKYTTLAEGRGMSMEATRQFVRRARERFELFTVTHDGETIVPAFLLDAAMQPIAAYRPVIRVLREAGEDGWALWTWFATPSSWLGNRRPTDVIDKEPDVVLAAALRRASNVA